MAVREKSKQLGEVPGCVKRQMPLENRIITKIRDPKSEETKIKSVD